MRKITIIFLFATIFLISGCSNMISSLDQEPSDSFESISFSLSDDVANAISKTVSSSYGVSDTSQVTVECEAIGLEIGKTSKNVMLKDISGMKFNIEQVPLNKDFRIKISILIDNILIYEGVSDKQRVTPEKDSISIKLIMEKKPCKITYVMNNSGAIKDPNPSEYYIDSPVSLSSPKNNNSNLDFCGWYTKPDFTGSKITDLGSENFLGNVTLYAKWSYNKEVRNLKAERGDGNINLTWNNPDTNDFSKIIISCPDIKDVEITNKGENSKISLPNGKKYTFNLKVVDNNGFESKGVNVTGETWYTLTEDVEVLPAGTDGTFGTGGQYVLFGDFPQTKASISSNNIVSDIDDINDTSYVMGDDGYYYYYYLSTGNQGVYYKVEPIKWRVLTDNYVDGSGSTKGKLLMAENALTAIDFYTSLEGTAVRPSNVYVNNYKYSNIRAYLNSLNGSSYDAYDYSPDSGFVGFIDGAFNAKAKLKLIEIEVDNSVASTGQKENKYVCDNTKDKVFLMSYKELTSSEFGFNTNGSMADSKRSRKVTDFSKDKASTDGIVSAEGVCDYWLRSPANSMEAVRVFIDYNKDETIKQYAPNNNYGRVVPAVVVSF